MIQSLANLLYRNTYSHLLIMMTTKHLIPNDLLKFNVKLFFYGVISVFLLLGCSQKEPNQQPKRAVTPPEVQTLVSDININAKVESSAIQKLVNSQFPITLYSFNETLSPCYQKKVIVKISFDCDLEGEFTKSSDIILNFNKNSLSASVPAHIKVTGEVKGIGLQETVHADVIGNLSVSPIVSENWELKPNAVFDINWIDYPTIVLFDKVKISLPDRLFNKAKKLIAEKFNALSTDTIDHLNIHAKAQKLWLESFNPIQLSEKENIWLRLAVQDAYFSGIQTNNNVASAIFGIKATTELFTEKPEVLTPTALPALKTDTYQNRGLHIRVPLTASYTSIKENLNQLLKDLEKWNNSIIAFKVKNLEIYPSNDSLVIGMDYLIDFPYQTLDVNGQMFISGHPFFNNSTKEISISDFKFNGFSDQKFADLLVSTICIGIEYILTDELKISFKEQYDHLIAESNSNLNKTLAENIKLHGEITQAELSGIYLSANNLTVLLDATGNLELEYGDL